MNEFLPKTIQLYAYLGIWPLAGSSEFLEKLRYAFGLFFVISVAVLNALEYADVFMQWGRCESVFENASVTFMITVILFKIHVIYNHRNEMALLSAEIDSYVKKIFLENIDEEIILLLDYRRRVQNVNKFLCISTLLCVMFVYAWPASTILLAGDYSLRPLMFPVHLPFSLNATGNYVFTYISEAVLGSVAATYMIGFDTFFVSCILFAILRLKILQHSIETVGIVARQKSETFPKDDCVSITTSREKFQRNSGIGLKKCIDEHRRIIAFCKTTDSMISLILFIVFFAYAVIICLVGFYAILLGPNLNLLKLGLFLIILLAQIFLYFWHGNELMEESLKVADSAFRSGWHDVGKHNIQTITFMILRSRKPIVLTVGKFYTVTLQTVISLLRLSYSYFALLKQSYE